MKAFLCTWLSIISFTLALISRDRPLGMVFLIIALTLLWLAGS